MSFAFNFLPPETTTDEPQNTFDEPPTKTNNGAAAHNKTDVAASASAAAVSQEELSHPFSWKENLETVLEERAQQQIVFQDIDLSLDDGDDDDDDELDCDDEQQIADDKEPTPPEPLRRVCMEHYQKEVTPGVYEGGLQVWECSLDLVRYFQHHQLGLGAGETCLELGCGHALPGCWLLREALQRYRAKKNDNTSAEDEPAFDTKVPPPFQVVFVDYNDYVIDDVTLSNIVLNTAGLLDNAKTLAQHRLVQVGAGDWKDMSRQFTNTVVREEDTSDGTTGTTANRRFDWILAAETTYTPEASQDTAELLLLHLTVGTGIGWIASKRYYFGVGGGTDALREAASRLSQSATSLHYLTIETAQVIDNGAGNIREILKVTCHNKEDI